MKPRIYLKWGIWFCASVTEGGRRFQLGYGYSPREAYADWAKQKKGA